MVSLCTRCIRKTDHGPGVKELGLCQVAISVIGIVSLLSGCQNNLDDTGELVHHMYQKK
jgi:hypothetical protein